MPLPEKRLQMSHELQHRLFGPGFKEISPAKIITNIKYLKLFLKCYLDTAKVENISFVKFPDTSLLMPMDTIEKKWHFVQLARSRKHSLFRAKCFLCITFNIITKTRKINLFFFNLNMQIKPSTNAIIAT